MYITEQEKLAAITVMVITYGDGNSVPMYGLVYRLQRKPRMTQTERMSVEVQNFYQHVHEQHAKGNVLLAQIYKNTYRQTGKFEEAPQRLMLEWRNGYWNDKPVVNKSQVTGQTAGDEYGD